MTVSSTTNRKSFAGDGVTTSFGTSPVVFFNSSELVVQVVVTATGAATTLVEGTNYTVTGGNGAVGTVNLAGGTSPNGAPSALQTLLIRRVLPLTQTDDFVNNAINDAEVTERRFDKTVMQIQQLGEEIGRGLVIPASESATAALTVLPFDRASKFLAFNASKEMIASSGTVNGAVPVSAFMATVLDDTTAADARTTLGAAGSGAVTGSGLTMATSRLLGRTTAATGAIEELTLSQALDLVGSAAHGDILYRGASSWTRLAAGASGQFLQTAGAGGNPVWASVSSITLSTLQASTSGTSIDFNGLPSGIKRITVLLSGVSTNGTSNPLIQFGDSGGVESSGYTATVGGVSSGSTGNLGTSTAGLMIQNSTAAARAIEATIICTLMDAATNRWAMMGVALDGSIMWVSSAGKSLSATLDRVRITTVGGTDTFDAGNINITYE